MTSETKDLQESAELNLKLVISDQDHFYAEREKLVKSMFGKKHIPKLDFGGKPSFNVRDCMNQIFERTLTDEEFQHYYPIYALGFQTGRLLGLSGKKQTLESQIRSLARINGEDNHAK